MATALASKHNPCKATTPKARLRPLFLRKRRTFSAKKTPRREKVYGRGCCKGAVASLFLSTAKEILVDVGKGIADIATRPSLFLLLSQLVFQQIENATR